jgi:hypothetical protein
MMNNKKQTYTRKEKIRLLQQIKEGRIKVEQLQPPKFYLFKEDYLNPGTYEMEGKKYSEEEYQAFCKRVKQIDNSSIVWHEMKTYPKENTIITIRYK